MDDFKVLSRWLKSSAERSELHAAREQLTPLLEAVGRQMDAATAELPGGDHLLVYLRCLYLELEQLDALAAKRLVQLGPDDTLESLGG